MQQINLYLNEFRPNRGPLRSSHILLSCTFFIMALLIYSFFVNRQHQILQQQLTQGQEAHKTFQAQLSSFNVDQPTQVNAELDNKIIQLQKSLQRHQQVLAMIGNQNLGNDTGFSAHLTALRQAALNTVSIVQFALTQGGKYAELEGLTTSADQVPLYIQRLRQDAAFVDVGLGVLTLERDAQQTGVLKFSLSQPKEESATDVAGEGAW